MECKNAKLKRFDLKAGDLVYGDYKDGGKDVKRKWRVKSIYPNIFVCETLGNVKQEQAFDKVAYQIGEVTRA